MNKSNEAIDLLQQKLDNDLNKSLKTLGVNVEAIRRQAAAPGGHGLGSGNTLIEVSKEFNSACTTLAENLYIDVESSIEKGVITHKDDFINLIHQSFADVITELSNSAIERFEKLNKLDHKDKAGSAVKKCLGKIDSHTKQTVDDLLLKLKSLDQELKAEKKKASSDFWGRIFEGIAEKLIWLAIGSLLTFLGIHFFS